MRCVPIWPEGGTRGQDLVHGLSFLPENRPINVCPCRPACEQGSQQLLVWAQGNGGRARGENRMLRLACGEERTMTAGGHQETGTQDKGACIRVWGYTGGGSP